MEQNNLEQKLSKALSHKELYKTALDKFCVLYQRKMSELSLIKRITDSLNYISDLQKVCDHIVDCIIDETNAENCSLMLLNRDTDTLSIICAKGYKDTRDPSIKRKIKPLKKFSTGTGVAGVAVRGKKPILVKDASTDERFAYLGDGIDEIGSLITSPLMINDDVIGVFNVSHPNPNNFSEQDLQTITIISNQAALAIFSAKMYSQLIQFNTELIKEVTEKEQDIKTVTNHLKEAQRRLIQTKKLHALGEMASGVAHDFNNVLGVILGNMKLINRNFDKTEKVMKYLGVIEKAANDGAETVKRIQEYSRVRVSSDEFKTVNMDEILHDVMSFSEPKWQLLSEKKGIRFEIDKSGIESNINIKANPSELRESFINIINNAVDAMPNGGTISISSTCLDRHVLISITDSGCGMTEEVIEKIFDPFFTTKGVQGNGMGMSVTYGIIKRHQGDIFIDSKVNKGTTVTTRLPIHFEVKEQEDQKAAVEETYAGDTAKILVIEDEVAIAEMIQEFLSYEGHKVDIVHDGEAGLRAYYDGSYDIIISDMGLPKKSGLDVAKEVKEDCESQGKKLSFIMITGWGSNFQPEKLEDFGIDVLFTKPIKFEQLLSFIRKALVKKNG